MFTCTCYNADLATFRIMFPGLATVSDIDVQDALDKAYCVLSDTYWGQTKCEATLYLAAHNIAYLQNAAAASSEENGFVVTNQTAGSITSASAGGLSVSYGSQSTSTYASTNPFDAYYSQTPYGLAFLSLAKSRMPRMIVGGC